MDSIWTKTKMPSFPSLDGDKKTDVLIIGGGAAGLLTAYLLKRAGVDCILVEKDRICSGVTSGTTAKITAQHGFIYQKLLARGGMELAGKYYRANTDAIAMYAKLASDIDCGFEAADNYVYTRRDKQLAYDEMRVLDAIGARAKLVKKTSLPIKIEAAVKFPDQAQFDPIRFFAEIAKDLPIYENTFAKNVSEKTVDTDKGKITAESVIVATHFPFIDRHGSYFLKMYQYRSYVAALEGADDVHGMYVDEKEGGLSFRNTGDILLIGGFGGKTGKTCGSTEKLRTVAKKLYPESSVITEWATQDCMTLDGIPYIGHYSALTKDMYVATGFNKWGMTGSMVAATLLSDSIMGKKRDYADIFSPSRSMLTTQLVKNCGNALMNLFTPSLKRCTHLGCALKWNKDEHTWDCPCHGSRFTDDGEVIDNPADKGLRK